MGKIAQFCAVFYFHLVTMPNYVARSCLPKLSGMLVQLGVAPGPSGYATIKQKFNGVRAPSVREVQEMLGAKYGLSKDSTCDSLLVLLNKQAQEGGIAPFTETEIVKFNSYLPDFGNFFAKLDFQYGTHAVPIEGIAVASGYSTVVIQSAISRRLLPVDVCRAISAAAHSVYGIRLIEPLTLREADGQYRPPAVEAGRFEIINRLRG